jgi:hypothetical protein
VPERIYDRLLSASSVGRHFDKYVKKAGYRCGTCQGLWDTAAWEFSE